jgi:16S rRNA (cytidine1402-2'-O)-methyltransferase
VANQKSISNRQNMHPGPQLYVVATPIGNLEDLSPRARRVLIEADELWCEDTRVGQNLCRAIGIEPKTVHRLDHHIDEAGLDRLIRRQLDHSLSVALLSDAGTPGVQDPGSALIRRIRDLRHSIRIHSIPGPSAVVAALSLLGAQAERFSFQGFFPRDRKAAEACLEARLKPAQNEVQIFFESPDRVLKTVSFWATWFLGHLSGRSYRFWLVKELTKVFETVHEFAAPAALLEWTNTVSEDELKGEWVMAFEVTSAPIETSEPLLAISDAWIAAMLTHGVSARDAANIAHEACGVPNNVAYRQALDRKKSG